MAIKILVGFGPKFFGKATASGAMTIRTRIGNLF